jgi:protein phosphatase PTC1
MVCHSLFTWLTFSRRGKAVRLSYDHKGTDEAEGRRIAAAGGLILNSRVNGKFTWFMC